MTEDHERSAAGRPWMVRRTGQLTITGLLVATAVVALASPFGTFATFRYAVEPGGRIVTQLLAGWWFELVGLDVPLDRVVLYRVGDVPLTSLPIAVAAALAVAAAILLILRPAVGRALAVLAGGLLAGCVAVVWLDLLALAATIRPDTGQQVAELGVGAWVVLGAAVIGLVAAGLAVALRPATEPAYVPHPGTPSLLAGVLLSVAAVLAVAGSLGALVVGRATNPPTTVSTTGWMQTVVTGAPGRASVLRAPLLGLPLVAGSALAVMAAVLIVLSTRTHRDPVRARLLGVGACGLIAGTVAPIWLSLVAAMVNADVLAARGAGQTVAPGAGAWLVLSAGAAALLAVGLLLVPARRRPPVPHAPPWAEPPAG